MSIAALTLVGMAYESMARSADAERYPPPGQRVAVGGHRLHIHCTGTGSPTVVIDAGLGDWSTTWAKVQPEVARQAHVCTYDRAGYGWSDAGPLPRDAETFARELRRLLREAGIPGPYVLAGHSLGGLTVRVFAGTFPSDVAGVVLVDSMSPGQIKPSSAPPGGRSDPQARAFVPATLLARVGLVRLLAKPLGLVPDLPPRAEQEVVASMSGATYLQTVLGDESQGLPDSLKQAQAVTSLGRLPLIVLTARLNPIPGWQEWQAELLQLSPNSRQVLAESDHSIEILQPEAAVDAILTMVRLVRQTR